MAINTENKQRSALANLRFLGISYPTPDQSLEILADWQHMAGFYRGVLTTEVTTPVYVYYTITEKSFGKTPPDMLVGESRPKGIKVKRSDGEIPTITSPTVTIYNTLSGEEDTAEASAESDTESDGVTVWAVLAAGSSTGPKFAIFKATDGDNIIKHRLNYYVRQG